MSWRKGRAKKRADAIAAEFDESVEPGATPATVALLPNDELFVIDTGAGAKAGGGAGAKQVVNRSAKSKQKGKGKKGAADRDAVQYDSDVGEGAEVKRARQRAAAQKRVRKRAMPFEPTVDVWADGDHDEGAGSKAGGAGVAVAEAGSKSAVDRRASKKQRVVPAKVRSKKAARPPPEKYASTPAVIVPSGGTSYNPELEEHQDAVGVLVARELRRKWRAEDRAEAEKLDPTYVHTLDDLADGNDDSGSDSGDEGGDALSQGATIRPPKPLTRQQRNRREMLKEEARQREAKKKEKRLLDQIDRLKVIKKELDEEEKRKKELKVVRERLVELRKEEAATRMQLPKYNEVALSEDLKGNLRSMRATASALKDRFHSIVHRGLAVKATKRDKPRKNIRILKNK